MAEADLLLSLIRIVISLVTIAGLWKVFQKADKPGWAAVIPIYNLWVLIKVSGNSALMFILMFIPILNLYPIIKVPLDIAKKFGQGTGFGIGLIFLSFIFYPLLGFGSYQYEEGATDFDEEF